MNGTELRGSVLSKPMSELLRLIWQALDGGGGGIVMSGPNGAYGWLPPIG